MRRKIVKLLRSIQKAPERKHYLEFITAALSIPVLLTVILLNLNNLNSQKKDSPAIPTPQTKEIIIRDNSGDKNTPKPTDTPTCKKGVGTVTISYPKEGAAITDNPVNFIILHDEAYCSVVWSYRIQGGTWSEYSSNSPSVYNMASGQTMFELRVQSTVSQDQQMFTRNFNYQGAVTTATPTSAAIITPTPSPFL